MKYTVKMTSKRIGEKGQRIVEGTIEQMNMPLKRFVAKDHVDSSYPDRFKLTSCGGKRLDEKDEAGNSWSRGERIAVAAFCSSQTFEKVEESGV